MCGPKTLEIFMQAPVKGPKAIVPKITTPAIAKPKTLLFAL